MCLILVSQHFKAVSLTLCNNLPENILQQGRTGAANQDAQALAKLDAAMGGLALRL